MIVWNFQWNYQYYMVELYIYMEFPMIIVAIMISVSYHPLAAQVTF